MSRLAIDSNYVVGMRMMRMAMGGAGAMREAELMVTEKMQTAASLAVENAIALGTGASLDSVNKRTMARYHKVVRANRRRLSRD